MHRVMHILGLRALLVDIFLEFPLRKKTESGNRSVL